MKVCFNIPYFLSLNLLFVSFPILLLCLCSFFAGLSAGIWSLGGSSCISFLYHFDHLMSFFLLANEYFLEALRILVGKRKNPSTGNFET